MYTKKNLSSLKQLYSDEDVSEEIKEEIHRRLIIEKKKVIVDARRKNTIGCFLCFAYAFIFLMVIGRSQTFRVFAEEVPLLKEAISVITGEVFIYRTGQARVEITAPQINSDTPIFKDLNQLYLKEGKIAYLDSLKEIEAIEAQQIGIFGHYQVLVNNDRFLVIEQFIEKIVGGSMQAKRFVTIDKKNEVVLSLPLLFQNKNYLHLISEDIHRQMQENASHDKSQIYWPIINKEDFKLIDDPEFYIDAEGYLVISFDKYEVAPGYMGAPQFRIDNEQLNNSLVNKNYLSTSD
jgi:hypothetical protein